MGGDVLTDDSINRDARINIVGDLHLEKISDGGKRNNHSNDVLGTDGISTAVMASAGMGGGHVQKIEVQSTPIPGNDSDGIQIVGKLTDTSFEQAQRVNGTEGIAPSMKSRDGKEPSKIDVSDLDGTEPDTIISGVFADCNVEQARRVYGVDGLSPSITAGGGTGSITKIDATEEDPSEQMPNMDNGDVCAMLTPGRAVKRQAGRRFKNPDEEAFAVTTVDRHGLATKTNDRIRIRYITEREALRLMGQRDDAIDRIFEVEPAKTVRYRLAGNSIVVDVLEAIFKGIYVDKNFKPKRKTLEDFL